MFAQLVKPGIKKLVGDMFTGVGYLLTQQEYDELVAEEIVSRRFAIGWDSVILPLKVLIPKFLVLMIGKPYTE
jgi:hypothetical protein